MKMQLLERMVQSCLLAGAFAMPAAFAQASTPAPMHEGSVKEPMATTAPAPAAIAVKPMGWKDLDTNKDGQISKNEAAADATLNTDFDSADTDKNGSLSRAEFKKYASGMKKQVSMRDARK